MHGKQHKAKVQKPKCMSRMRGGRSHFKGPAGEICPRVAGNALERQIGPRSKRLECGRF